MNRRGFTIVELIITISIMAILLTLGTISLSDSQANARDSERKTDINTIALHLETFYISGTNSSTILTDCTGGNITHDGIYTVHKFISSGAITCDGSIDGDVLVVGGGGGSSRGGGGGGGYLTGTETLSGAMSVTVGLGGIGRINDDGTDLTRGGTNGQDSLFGSRTAKGGGGGSYYSATGYSGGSGGGGGNGDFTQAGGAGTAGQGYGGGNNIGYITSPYPAGGGGGAGGAGGNPTSLSNAGAGGIGINNDIVLRGTNVGYAGGGGGAMWLTGIGGTATHGGGVGNNFGIAGASATPNTGGGGGGGGRVAAGGNGGSGIVVIRYLTPIIGAYPSTLITATSLTMTKALRDIDIKSISAPGITDPMLTFIPATNSIQTTDEVTPQPTIDQYVYQPLKQDRTLCSLASDQCQKFNLYYRLEADSVVYVETSKNQ